MNREIKTVTLNTGFKRGDDIIKTVEIRKPTTGELRGVRLLDLAYMDVDAITTVIPRVTIPSMIAAEVRQMDPADFTLLATEIATFLAPSQQNTDSPE